MKPMLHDTNEEADLHIYRTYVRSLSYDDLRDIRVHLDEDLYPARYDVLRREIERRNSACVFAARGSQPGHR